MTTPTRAVLVSAESLERDLRSTLEALDEEVAAAGRAFRAAPSQETAEAFYIAYRQRYSLACDLVALLGDHRLGRAWRGRDLAGVGEWSPRLRVGVGQKPLIPQRWKEQVEQLRALRAGS